LRISLGWTILVAPLIGWALYELYRIRRRRLLIRKNLGKTPPYSWPIRSDQPSPAVYEGPELAALTQLMLRRSPAESERLDIEATVAASIAALGFPAFRYRKDTRIPEYLVLIDRTGFRDHQACLFDSLTSALREQGLFVTEWFYEGDPRICWDRAGE